MTPPIFPLTCYSLRGFDPSERFAFVVAVAKDNGGDRRASGFIVSGDGIKIDFWDMDGFWCWKQGSENDLIFPIPYHPLPECLKHLRPEPVAWLMTWPDGSVCDVTLSKDQARAGGENELTATPLAPIIGQ